MFNKLCVWYLSMVSKQIVDALEFVLPTSVYIRFATYSMERLTKWTQKLENLR